MEESCFPRLPLSQVKIFRYDHIAEKEQREDKMNKQAGRNINTVIYNNRQCSPMPDFLALPT